MYKGLAKEILDNGWYVGVRSLCPDEQYEVGDECRESYEWDFENDCSTYHTTGETAGGTCATYIDTQFFVTDDQVSELAVRIAETIKKNSIYGGQQVIIAGHSVNNDGAFDSDEVRIVGAWVLAKVEQS